MLGPMILGRKKQWLKVEGGAKVLKKQLCKKNRLTEFQLSGFFIITN